MNARARRQPGKLRKISGIAFLVIAAICVVAFMLLRYVEHDVERSHRALPKALTHDLARSTDLLHTPQTTLFEWDGSVVLARTDPPAQTIALLSIPRSARVALRNRTLTLATVSRHGLHSLLVGLGGVLHARLSHVVKLDDAGLARLVDGIGGISVRDPLFGHRPADLDGANALRYIDLPTASPRQRSLRRQAVMDGLVRRLVHPTDLTDAANEIDNVARAVTTDLTSQETLALALVRADSRHFIDCRLAPRQNLHSVPARVTMRGFLNAPPAPPDCQTRPLEPALPSVATTVLKRALDLYPIAGVLLLSLAGASVVAAALLLSQRRPRLAVDAASFAPLTRGTRSGAGALAGGAQTFARTLVRPLSHRRARSYGYGTRGYPVRRRRLARTIEDAFYAVADGWDHVRRVPARYARRPPRRYVPSSRADDDANAPTEEPKRAGVR